MAVSYLHITPKVGESYTTSVDATRRRRSYREASSGGSMRECRVVRYAGDRS